MFKVETASSLGLALVEDDVNGDDVEGAVGLDEAAGFNKGQRIAVMSIVMRIDERTRGLGRA